MISTIDRPLYLCPHFLISTIELPNYVPVRCQVRCRVALGAHPVNIDRMVALKRHPGGRPDFDILLDLLLKVIHLHTQLVQLPWGLNMEKGIFNIAIQSFCLVC